MIGELYQSFRFDTEPAAKAAWERVAEHCRNISVNRWLLYPMTAKTQVVTILGEYAPKSHTSYMRALRILSETGKPINTPAGTLKVMRDKRIANIGQGRQVVRSPLGTIVTDKGEVLGPFRRPQG